MQIISSIHNPLIKEMLRLQQKPAERKKAGRFLVEGRREAFLALNSGLKPDFLFWCPDIFAPDPEYPIGPESVSREKLVQVNKAVYNKMAYRENQEGILITGPYVQGKLRDWERKEAPLYLIVDAVEKPGNLGAILRTADAAGVDGIILTNPGTDPMNPNVIRSSLGCVFTLPIATATEKEAIEWLKQRNIDILAAALRNSKNCFEADYRRGTALVFGAEDKGLSETWLNAAGQIIQIPMHGIIDSLNVSASAAILIYEAIRQRRYQRP